jgi:hypothetical protein
VNARFDICLIKLASKRHCVLIHHFSFLFLLIHTNKKFRLTLPIQSNIISKIMPLVVLAIFHNYDFMMIRSIGTYNLILH